MRRSEVGIFKEEKWAWSLEEKARRSARSLPAIPTWIGIHKKHGQTYFRNYDGRLRI